MHIDEKTDKKSLYFSKKPFNFYILILTFTKIHKSNTDKLLLKKYDIFVVN